MKNINTVLWETKDSYEVGCIYRKLHSNCSGVTAMAFINHNLTPSWVISDILKRDPPKWIKTQAEWQLSVRHEKCMNNIRETLFIAGIIFVCCIPLHFIFT